MSAKPTYEELLRKNIDLERRCNHREEIICQYEQIFALTKDLCTFIDENYTYQLANKSYAKGHNKTPEEIIGKSVADVLGDDLFLNEIKSQIDRCLSGEIVRYQAWFDYPTVGRRYRDITYYPSRQSDGNKKGILAIIRDLTDLKFAEEQQILEYERLTTLINASPDIICFKDGEGRWLLANESDLQLFQLAGVDYTNKTDAELAPYSEFYHDAFLACMITDEEAWGKGELSRTDETIPIPDGTNKVFDVVKIPLFHSDGTRKGLVVLGHDITERLVTEKRLRQEIVARQQAGEVMLEKSLELEEANAALRVILKHRDEDKKRLEHKLQSNIDQLVLPLFSKLRNTTIDPTQDNIINSIEANLLEVSSPFAHQLSSLYTKLTPAEIQVANLIKNRHSSKEIATWLNLSVGTIYTHRRNIRKKSGITNKKVNLQSILTQLQ